MRIGVLTGGGDCPGLNAVIRAIVRKGIDAHGHEFVGFRYGWAGVLDDDGDRRSPRDATRGILHRGGTILGILAHEPVQGRGRPRAACKASMAAARPRRADPDRRRGHARRRAAGCTRTASTSSACRRRSTTTSPATDFTFGFQTAVQIATDAIDRLHTTAESHNRVIVVEVMGRHAGWIAVYSGMAGGADVILVPERPFDIDEVCERIRAPPRERRARSRSSSSPRAPRPRTATWSAEHGGTTDAFGHVRLGGIAVAARARDRGAHRASSRA